MKIRTAFSDSIVKKYPEKYVGISSLPPMSYWVKLPVNNETLIKQDGGVQVAMGATYSPHAADHIIGKTYPELDLYETGIQKPEELIRKAMDG